MSAARSRCSRRRTRIAGTRHSRAAGSSRSSAAGTSSPSRRTDAARGSRRSARARRAGIAPTVRARRNPTRTSPQTSEPDVYPTHRNRNPNTNRSQRGRSRQRPRWARPQAEGTTLPAAYHTLDGWEPTEADIAYAEMAGLPRADFLEAIAKARLIPRIGGAHGVRDQGAWVRLQVPRWKRWKDEASAKQSFGRAPAPVEPIRPRRKERDHAVHWGYDIDALFEAINAEGWPAKAGAEGARREAQRRMAAAAKAAKGAA